MADITVTQPTSADQATWGKRTDGSAKGLGFFGALKRPDGQVSSELAIGVNLGGKELEVPLIVPTLSRGELDHLLNGGKPTEVMVQKAVDHAKQRIQAGASPFAGAGEQLPLPAVAEEAGFLQGFEGAR